MSAFCASCAVILGFASPRKEIARGFGFRFTELGLYGAARVKGAQSAFVVLAFLIALAPNLARIREFSKE